MVSEEGWPEAIEAVNRFRTAMKKAGLALISTDALKEGWGHYTDEVNCPYCTEWNSVTMSSGEDEIIVKCIGCGKSFRAQHVQYLISDEWEGG